MKIVTKKNMYEEEEEEKLKKKKKNDTCHVRCDKKGVVNIVSNL